MTDDDDHPFDPKLTPCRGLGIVADTFWRLPRVLRSNSPHAFAASGRAASSITAPHPLDLPHGPDSPVGRVHQLEGQVLLLGVNHDADTTVHLADAEIDHCCQNFNFVDDWLDVRGLQRRGRVGRAQARLARARDIVEVVSDKIRANETVFLHPLGVDEECDDARRSLVRVMSR